jgi:hypothetical protein
VDHQGFALPVQHVLELELGLRLFQVSCSLLSNADLWRNLMRAMLCAGIHAS